MSLSKKLQLQQFVLFIFYCCPNVYALVKGSNNFFLYSTRAARRSADISTSISQYTRPHTARQSRALLDDENEGENNHDITQVIDEEERQRHLNSIRKLLAKRIQANRILESELLRPVKSYLRTNQLKMGDLKPGSKTIEYRKKFHAPAHHLYNTYGGDPGISKEIVQGPWSWRDEETLDEMGMFRGEYRLDQDEKGYAEYREDFIEVGLSAEGRLYDSERKVWLRDDENFAMRINGLRKYKDEYGHCNVPVSSSKKIARVYTRLAKWCQIMRFEYSIYNIDPKYSFLTPYRIGVLDDLGFEWDSFQTTWNQNYRKLKAFKRKHGHCLVPINNKEDRKLSIWVEFQRKQYQKFVGGGTISSMTLERIDLLDEIGFVWNVYHETWNKFFYRLLMYKEKYGNTMVPSYYEADQDLANWVVRQRENYKKFHLQNSGQSDESKIHGALSTERTDLLNEEGFSWDPREDTWHIMFDQLMQYKAKHGDCFVPRRFSENQPLANWAKNQREYFLRMKIGKYSPLTESRIIELSDAGFEFELSKMKWELRYDQLKKFTRKNGHTMVPIEYEENPELGMWVKTQRRQYVLLKQRRRSSLTKERIQRLEEINFVFIAEKDDRVWNEHLDELVAYKTEHSTFDVSPSNPKLQKWVHTQRWQYKQYKSGKKTPMTRERIRTLQRLGFNWTSEITMRNKTWNDRFQELVEYKKLYGDCNVVNSYKEIPGLATWVASQRSFFRKLQKSGEYTRAFTEERMKALENLGFQFVVNSGNRSKVPISAEA